MNMTYSLDGQRLTQQFESCRLVAYKDSKGVWTIGWGHTRGVFPGMTCTQEQADVWFRADVAFAEAAVNRDVHVPLTQHEFDALVDFTFNCGVGNFDHSTLLTLLNAGRYADAAKQLERWDMSGVQHLAGLLRRRIAEENLFNQP